MPVIGIGVNTAKGGSQSWNSYWIPRNEVLFFGQIKNIRDGKLYNEKRGASDYLTVGGVAGSYTFQAPNTADYITADTDYIWFKQILQTQRTTTTAELIGYDFTRTIVKYADADPYAIDTIMILKEDFESAKMRNDFHLSIWWDNTLSLYGNVKGNRGIGQNVWTAESTAIVDADGNKYTEIVIGTQTWLVENLKTTKYNDGSTIPSGLSDANWALEDGSAGHDGAFAYPNNDAGNKAVYGLLYNWQAINNAKGIAPAGYRVATNSDYTTLQTALGGASVAGGHMKEAGTVHWLTTNTADNSSGFTALPAGRRIQTGAYNLFGSYGFYWSSTQSDATNALRWFMINNSAGLSTDAALKLLGISVRCIKI